jgi:competence protein ComEC
MWLLPALCFKPPAPAWGELRFTLLDVGQGLSAVVQTQSHILVFDTGARSGPEFDMGEAVVLPFLRSQGVKQLDMLVISHGDNDHSGGAQALLRAMPVHSLQTSVPLFFSSWPAEYCLAGKAWDWDGVHFAFLHPIVTQLDLDNDSSCVLQVTTQSKRLILPGDIEKAAERVLLANPGLDLSADLLVAPHHGSKTSGLRDFIGRVHPQYVLYAIGYRNRYHFPYPAVMATYKEFGAIQLDTVIMGAIQFEMGKKYLSPPKGYRPSHQSYWNSIISH